MATIQTYKPDSVPLRLIQWLPSFISFCRHRQNLATYPPGLGEQPSGPGLHGLAIHEVYPLCASPHKAVGSYPTLFTLTPIKSRRYCLCGTFYCSVLPEHLPVKKRGALYCPDFPITLKSGIDGTVCTKVRFNSGKKTFFYTFAKISSGFKSFV